MNEFIKLRKSNSNFKNTYDFTTTFVKEFMNIENMQTKNAKFFKNKLDDILDINQKKRSDEKKFETLLSYIGEDPYIDRFTIDKIVSIYNLYPKEKLISLLKTEIEKEDNNEEKNIIS
ncbi:hypothetical protein LZ578_04995 [Jeotgalibaca sp. MA1X17-3]|uniref:hypothetical protein n=1 Tax=Jeotgalibaca sp. MA1X17-3 TaxID=2908211 RepID=UPI001F298BC1|nr:hypothetical protein [Jeotgalibaca sp. MA1X17-3]UJF16464.1 hypothetical protein LZ578_04995 [Jeotgalibaca sp. MA1X17-3]